MLLTPTRRLFDVVKRAAKNCLPSCIVVWPHGGRSGRETNFRVNFFRTGKIDIFIAPPGPDHTVSATR